MFREIRKNFKKDIAIEFRNKSALQVSVAFAFIVTIATGLIAGRTQFSHVVHSVLLWLILFFSAMNGLIHVFSREEDRKTSLFLRLYMSPENIYISKLLFNCVVYFILVLLIVPLYVFFLRVEIISLKQFVLTMICGGLGLVSSITIMSALVAKARAKESLLAVISFPVLLPVLWVAVDSTRHALEKNNAAPGKLLFLLAFSGGVMLLSLLLFKYIWLEE